MELEIQDSTHTFQVINNKSEKEIKLDFVLFSFSFLNLVSNEEQYMGKNWIFCRGTAQISECTWIKCVMNISRIMREISPG